MLLLSSSFRPWPPRGQVGSSSRAVRLNGPSFMLAMTSSTAATPPIRSISVNLRHCACARYRSFIVNLHLGLILEHRPTNPSVTRIALGLSSTQPSNPNTQGSSKIMPHRKIIISGSTHYRDATITVRLRFLYREVRYAPLTSHPSFA